jgi:hypothetical protein
VTRVTCIQELTDLSNIRTWTLLVDATRFIAYVFITSHSRPVATILLIDIQGFSCISSVLLAEAWDVT